MIEGASATRERASASTLRRDLELLEALAGNEALLRGGLGVARLAQIVGRDKSQVSRALRSLEAEGLVERDPDSLEYRLGWRLYAIASRAGESRLLHAAIPLLRDLVARLGETAHLCVLRGPEVLTLLTEAPAHQFRAFGWEGRGTPIPCTSAGRVLLMDATREQVRMLLSDTDFACPGPNRRITGLDDFYSELGAIRAAGYAKVDEEFEAGLVGVSAPVRDFRGRVVAAINVSAPKERLGDSLDAAGRRTAEVAAELSRRLGWTHPSASAGVGRPT